MRLRKSHYIVLVSAAWLLFAYLLLPIFWIERDRGVDLNPADYVTRTTDDIPGDPINVGLVGTKEDVIRAFAAANWQAADAITLASSVEIGVSVLFDHPDPDAPVSSLFYLGRRQDVAFEKPDGDSADKRHHVRLWQTPQAGANGASLWLGSASFDAGVGLSHTTGQITHHIAPDVDAERNGLMAELQKAGWIASTSERPGVGATQDGRNGGGDRYFTDGKVLVGNLSPPN